MRRSATKIIPRSLQAVPTRWLRSVYQRIRYCGESAIVVVGPEGCFCGATTALDSITYFTPHFRAPRVLAFRIPFSGLEVCFRHLSFPSAPWSEFCRYGVPFIYAVNLGEILYRKLLAMWSADSYIYVPAADLKSALRKSLALATDAAAVEDYDLRQVGFYVKKQKLLICASDGCRNYKAQMYHYGEENQPQDERSEEASNSEHSINTYALVPHPQVLRLSRWLETASGYCGVMITRQSLVVRTRERLLRVKRSFNRFAWSWFSQSPVLTAYAYFGARHFNRLAPKSVLEINLQPDHPALITEWLGNCRRQTIQSFEGWCVEAIQFILPAHSILDFFPVNSGTVVMRCGYHDGYQIELVAENESFSSLVACPTVVG